MHDLLITAGVYALTGREVTTSTVAALLTILGYSLYDTIIVFDRVRENVPRMPRAAFSQIVNRSMSEVLTRSLATSFCTLLPVLALLLFGGETLKDFAFALMVGIASGAYSSIFIASPVLTHWKEREGSYRNRRARLVRDLGFVPPYATALDGTPIDVEPVRGRKERSGAGNWSAGAFGNRAPAPGEPVTRSPRMSSTRWCATSTSSETVSRLSQAPLADLRSVAVAPGATAGAARPAGWVGLHRRAPALARRPRPPGRAPPRQPPPRRPEPTPSQAPQDPAADLTPEDLVLKEQPKRQKRPRNRRHGRAR